MLQKKDYTNPSIRILLCVEDVVTTSQPLSTKNEIIDDFDLSWLG